MKLLLVLFVVLLGAWLWRSNRAARRREPPSAPPNAQDAPGAPQEMVACGLCGVHVPRAEAVAGRNAHYCCPEHRQRAEP